MKAFSRTTAAAAVALAGALVSTNAPAVNLSNDEVGQVAIAPFYTTRNGWQTAINLTNTTNSPLLVKVRFHEGHNSRDVLDFNVALSAFDVFTGVVRENANGQPVFLNTDSPADGVGDERDDYTCTIPNTRTAAGDAFEVPLNHLGFSGDSISNFDDGETADNDDMGLGGDSGASANAGALERLKEGYVEFIVMGHADERLADASAPPVFTADQVFGPVGNQVTVPGSAGGALNNAINVARAIEQHDCTRLQTALGLYNETRAIQSARQFGQPVNALKFTFALINPQSGTAAGSPATTWANFYAPANGSGALDYGVPAGFVFPEDNFECDVPRGAEHFSSAAGMNWCPDGSGGVGCGDGLLADSVAAPAGPATLGNGESCRNLVTMQDFSEFLEPTLNDAYPHVAAAWEDKLNLGIKVAPAYRNSALAADGNDVEDTRGVDAVSLTIQRQRIFNQFSNNATLGARTEAVVTAPTKAFYVDQGDGIQFQVPSRVDGLGGMAGWDTGAVPRNEAFVDTNDRADAAWAGVGQLFQAGVTNGDAPYAPFQRAFGQEVAGDRTTARACNTISFAVYDRAENTVAAAPPGEPPFSPAPPPESNPRDLCYESTVITFGPNTLGTAQNRLDVSDLVTDLANQTGNTSGWFSLVMGPDADTDGTRMNNDAYNFAILPATVVQEMDASAANNASVLAGAPVSVSGLPVIGFTLATLNFPARPDLSYGSVAEHSYGRSFLAE